MYMYTLYIVYMYMGMLYVHRCYLHNYYIRIILKCFNKNDRRCRDVKTQKECEQGRDG